MPPRRRVVLYGGSFNPPHIGHAMVAAWIGWTDQADEVWLVPTYRHAFGKPLLPFDLRVALCEALGDTVGPWVTVSRVEGELPTPSYTIDTLRFLAARHPDHTFRLVVGADTLPDTPRWKDWAAIEAEFRPLVVGRGGYPPVPGSPTFPEVSSTAIREALRSGDPIDGFVPARIAALLDAHDVARLL